MRPATFGGASERIPGLIGVHSGRNGQTATSVDVRTRDSSGSPAEFDNGQMGPLLESADDQPHARAALALDPRSRAGASTLLGPESARLESWRFVHRGQSPLHFEWRSSTQRRVRPVLVVPAGVAAELMAHLAQPERHDDAPRAL